MAHPSQEIFTAIRKISKDLHFETYDGFLPDAAAPYPFVWIGENSTQDMSNKSGIFGQVRQSVHVWHNDEEQRGIVSDMMLQIQTEARKLRATPHFYITVRGMSSNIITDRTTGRPLYHGILDIVIDFN